MSSVLYDDPYNSTFLTSCCKVSIPDDQQQCPLCRKDVYPFFGGMTAQERAEAAGGYGNHNTHMARAFMAGCNARRILDA
jgi:hypothetical protein